MTARNHQARFPLGEAFRASRRKAGHAPLRVLIVEDSQDDALFILRELGRGGYEPLYERVDTPEAMDEALSREPWDVVISDYYMPRFRAPDALALLRRRGSDAPFVIVSGKVGEELAVEAMKAGAHDYIMKDNMTRLCATVKRGLEEVEVRRERAQAEEKYRSIFENSTEGIFQTTVNGRILTANPALARIFGYESPEELMATISDVASQAYENPEDRVEFARLIRQQGTVSNFETRMRRRNGDVIWISANARALHNDGVLVGYEGTVSEITERKQAEEARLQLATIVESSKDAIIGKTLDGVITSWNRGAQSIYGYSAEEIIGRPISILVPPDRPDEIPTILENARRGESVDHFETMRIRKDGARIYVSITVSPIRDSAGNVVGASTIARDITEGKRAEEALRESEERSRTVLANAPVVLFALDREGVFTLSEGRGLEAMGLRPGQGVGRSIFDIYHDEPKSLAHIRRALSGEEFTSVDDLRRLGLVFEVRWSPVRDGSGTLTGVIGVATDITERKRAEEELRRSLDRLVALHEAGHVLGSTLEPEEIGTRLLGIMRRISGLTTAVISLRKENGRLGVWRSIGLENLGSDTRYAQVVREALEAALEEEATQVFTPVPSGAEIAVGLCLPLRVRERSLGVLEVYGPEALAGKDTVAILESLATQAASALENARLYGELAERERRLQELVGKILVAQEEERRRVAYEVHDGLAQVAAAAHQHLQAFAQYHPPASQEGREDLDRVSKLVRQTVGEARRIIADLRPTALDDLGLEAAVRLQLEALRAEGWQIGYEGDLDDERLPVHVETALFRVAQEALTNMVKHARTRRANLALERLRGPREAVRLSVRDYGVGFSPDTPASTSGPGERVGLSGMRERVALLGGDFRVASRPGAGTLIVAEVPLREFVAGPSGDSVDGR